MTGTELLVAVLERFSDYGDGDDVLVVYSTKTGQVRLKSNCAASRALGLASYAVADIQDLIVNSKEVADDG